MSAKQSKAVPAKPVEVSAHEDFMREVRPLRDWDEWLKLARVAVTLDQKLGLLHGAFNVDMGMEQSFRRLEFFFRVADGWTNSSLFMTKGISSFNEPKYKVGYDKQGFPMERSESEQRQKLARKAFDVLAASFFKMPEISSDCPDRGDREIAWINAVVSGPLFPIIQNFFRIDEERRHGSGICNLSHANLRSHNEKQAVEFLLKLSKFLWTWQESSIDHWNSEEEKEQKKKENIRMHARIDAAKPWMINVLSELGELRLLEKRLLELDRTSLSALRRIALQNELTRLRRADPVIKDRRVATLDEACYAGSQAGWLLKKHELLTREHKRLVTILEAEEKKRKAQREIERLTRT